MTTAAAVQQQQPLTVAELAARARAHPKTIRRAIERGDIDAYKPLRRWLIDVEEAERWLRGREARDPMPRARLDGKLTAISGGVA